MSWRQATGFQLSAGACGRKSAQAIAAVPAGAAADLGHARMWIAAAARVVAAAGRRAEAEDLVAVLDRLGGRG